MLEFGKSALQNQSRDDSAPINLKTIIFGVTVITATSKMMVLIYVRCMGSRLYTKYILVDLSNYLHRFFLLPITYRYLEKSR